MAQRSGSHRNQKRSVSVYIDQRQVPNSSVIHTYPTVLLHLSKSVRQTPLRLLWLQIAHSTSGGYGVLVFCKCDRSNWDRTEKTRQQSSSAQKTCR